MKVRKLASRILGLRDECTAFAFDAAVMRFGIWVENQLAEPDAHKRPSLAALLGIEEETNGMNDAALRFMDLLMQGKVR